MPDGKDTSQGDAKVARVVGDISRIKSLAEVLEWLKTAPSGTLTPAVSLVAILEPLLGSSPDPEYGGTQAAPQTWQERLWTTPGETRMSVKDVAEALGRSRHFVYRHTVRRESVPPIPHRKLEGMLAFKAAEVREWVKANEAPVRRLK